MTKVKFRTGTESVIEKLKNSSLVKDQAPTASDTKSSLMLIPINRVSINAQNVRKTFTSLESLSEFIAQIGWPDDALSGGLEDPMQWIEALDSVSDENKSAFQKIVQRALSIQSVGQLQPVGANKHGDRYDIVYGSTRAMACYLLKKDIALTVLDENDSLTALKAHLFENLERDDLSFTETVTGYLRLFELLLESRKIDRISRSTVMKVLNLSRTHALVWSKLLNTAMSDDSFRTFVLAGKFSGYRDAMAYIDETTKPSKDIDPQPLITPEFTPDAERNDHADVETKTADAPEGTVQPNNSNLYIAEPPSPRIQLSSEASHSDTMIQIVTAAFERLANQADHPASLHIKIHMEERFPIADINSAQRSIDWLAQIISAPSHN